ncbi:glucose 1-dehydrogenase [Alteromonadaceae bacterium BrNp21-10]|nr:glucose 1-dehydrogenase [Alteromonadaceae bacterium BrNp21-10]
MKMFAGKVALITGGSSGIGEATAIQFAKEGANIAIAARRTKESELVVKRILDLGGNAFSIKTDVSLSQDVEAMVDATLNQYGQLDYAINNAGIAGPRCTPVADISEEQWDEIMSINLKGVWLSMKHELRAMGNNGEAAIVNVSSIYGTKPSDIGHAAYSASKHAVIGLTKSAAADYGNIPIRINAVAPGFTLSEMVNPDRPGAAERYQALISRHSSMNRFGKAEEVANAIVWLCSKNASYVNGSVLSIDGGSTTRLY